MHEKKPTIPAVPLGVENLPHQEAEPNQTCIGHGTHTLNTYIKHLSTHIKMHVPWGATCTIPTAVMRKYVLGP